MRKRTIHGKLRMKHDQFLSCQWPTCFLQMQLVVSSYTCISVQTQTKSGYTYSTLLLYTPYIYLQATQLQQTQSPKWFLFSQLLIFNDCTCNRISNIIIVKQPLQKIHIQGYIIYYEYNLCIVIYHKRLDNLIVVNLMHHSSMHTY